MTYESHLEDMTLWELIEAFGRESTYKGMDYTSDDSYLLLVEIKKRLDEMGEVTGDCA